MWVLSTCCTLRAELLCRAHPGPIFAFTHIELISTSSKIIKARLADNIPSVDPPWVCLTFWMERREDMGKFRKNPGCAWQDKQILHPQDPNSSFYEGT